jgi:hypothetical protein
MAPFKIVFSGLMCHMDVDDNTKRAVIVGDGNHKAMIWARDVTNPGFRELLPPIGQWRRFLIPPDANIQINDLANTKIGDIPRDAVPSVKDFIERFDPHDEVVLGQKDNAVRGYIQYSGGTFTVTCYYPSSAAFDDNNYLCRAKELVLTTESTSPNVDIVDVTSGRSLTVPNNAVVAFTHLDKVRVPGDHKLYRHISKGVVKVKDMQTKKDQCACSGGILPAEAFYFRTDDEEDDVVILSIDVECTSSRFP